MYIYIYGHPPIYLSHFFNGIYCIKCIFSYTQFHYSFSNTFKLQMSQNTEKHSIFVYAFLKTSEKSPVFRFLTNSLLA